MDRRGKSDDHFEKEWQEAFEGFSQEPPPSVWGEIDRELAYDDIAVYRSRTKVYKWTAAAVIFLASLLGMTQFLYYSNLQQQRVISGAIDVTNPEKQEIAGVVVPETEKPSFLQRKLSPYFAYTDDNEEEQRQIPVFDEYQVKGKSSNLAVDHQFKDKEIYKVPVYHFERRRSGATSEEKYWAGVNVGSGSFDPNYQSENNTISTSTSPSFSSFNDQSVNNNETTLREGMSAGESVALGVNFGVKLNNRWSIESGVQYARADATTTTNVVIESSQVREVIPASSEIRSIPQVESILDSEEGELNLNYKDVDLANQFQFATVPVRAGYLLIDESKFQLQLNAGFAANLYLGNKLTDPDNEITDVTIGPGSSSPYRELSFSGLAGVQIGYALLDRFDLILEPNYSQSINSLTKESSGFTANPSGFGVMTGIRYKFK